MVVVLQSVVFTCNTQPSSRIRHVDWWQGQWRQWQERHVAGQTDISDFTERIGFRNESIINTLKEGTELIIQFTGSDIDHGGRKKEQGKRGEAEHTQPNRQSGTIG